MPSHNQVVPFNLKIQPPASSRFCHLTLKDLLTILIGITIPVAIGVYGAVTNDQAQKAARLAADEQQRIAAERRTFDVQRAADLHQQQLYKDFLDAMYVLHKDGELNDSVNPWAFANARYRAVHREFDGVRKVQALMFLKEKQMIGRRTCITGCEVKNVDDIIRLNGMSFDNLNLISETGGLNWLNLSCIQFDGISMINANFSQANLNGVTFSNSRLNGAKFNEISFNCTRFENTEMDGVDFGRSNLSGAVFVDMDLSTAKLTETQRKQARFENGTATTSTATTTKTTAKTTSTSSTPTTTTLPASTATVTTTTTTETTTSTTTTRAIPMIPVNATWSETGTTILSGLGRFQGLVFVDDHKFLLAESDNHRITQYNTNGTEGKVVAGGKGNGSRLDQLNQPTHIVVDKATDSLIICDSGNRRVVRWSLRNNTQHGEIVLDNLDCFGLALDEQRNLYVADTHKHEVRRYQSDDKVGIRIAGGNGNGPRLDQLYIPTYLWIDREQNVYISDNYNHRVMKWDRNATEGIVVAGGQSLGESSTQLANPDGLFVDNDGTLYVVENAKHQVTRWLRGAQGGTIIAGGRGYGPGASQLNYPSDFSFDRQGNLYVSDTSNGRVQRFSIQ